jgi:hypothetical protein
MALVASIVALPVAAAAVAAAVFSEKRQVVHGPHHFVDDDLEFEDADDDEYEDDDAEEFYDDDDIMDPQSTRPPHIGLKAQAVEPAVLKFSGMNDPNKKSHFDDHSDFNQPRQQYFEPRLLGTHSNGYQTHDVYQTHPDSLPDTDRRQIETDFETQTQERKVFRSDLADNHPRGLPGWAELPFHDAEREAAEIQANQGMVGHLDGYGPGRIASTYQRDPRFIGFQEFYRETPYMPYTNRSDYEQMPLQQQTGDSGTNLRNHQDTSHVRSTPIVPLFQGQGTSDLGQQAPQWNGQSGAVAGQSQRIFKTRRQQFDQQYNPAVPQAAGNHEFQSLQRAQKIPSTNTRRIDVQYSESQPEWHIYGEDTADRSDVFAKTKLVEYANDRSPIAVSEQYNHSHDSAGRFVRRNATAPQHSLSGGVQTDMAVTHQPSTGMKVNNHLSVEIDRALTHPHQDRQVNQPAEETRQGQEEFVISGNRDAQKSFALGWSAGSADAFQQTQQSRTTKGQLGYTLGDAQNFQHTGNLHVSGAHSAAQTEFTSHKS